MLHRIFYYLRHVFTAVDEYGIHSPLLFNWFLHVRAHAPSTRFSNIDGLYRQWIKSKESFVRTSTGTIPGAVVRIGSHIKKSTMPMHDRQILAQTAAFLNSKKILELGTNAGFTSLYIAAQNTQAEVFTIESESTLWRIAVANAQNAGIKNLKPLFGRFSEVLPSLCQEQGYFDMIVIDGDHTYTSTIDYVCMLIPYLSPKGLIVIHDIYWSAEMTKAWDDLCAMYEFTLCVDLYRLGMLFMNSGIWKTKYRVKK